MYADYLLKNTPTKHKKHIVNQKLEHFGDTNLKTRFDRIRVTFYKTRFVPSQDNASVSMSYEVDFIQGLFKKNETKLGRSFGFMVR
jgi:hypothetical protein